MATFDEFYASLDPDVGIRGKQFEKFVKWFLKIDPTWASQVDEVWLWNDYPKRWGADCGIDLVFTHKNGKTWAVQSKCVSPNNDIKKSEIDSFLSESNDARIDGRLLIASTDGIGKNAQQVINRQEKQVVCFLLEQFRQSVIEFPPSMEALNQGKRKEKKKPKPHQIEAIDEVYEGLKTADRGQVLMACGTGKTLTSLWIKEKLKAKQVLVLLPSLSLLSQTLQEWNIEANQPFKWICVCSDKSVAKDKSEDEWISNTSGIGVPVTSEPLEIKHFLDESGSKVVFSTYQSSQLIVEAQEHHDTSEFDLVIADEAHRCVGKQKSKYGNVLDAKKIKSSKRLFFTATPRVLTKQVKGKAAAKDIQVSSMDNEKLFGNVIFRLNFSTAIRKKLLTDYQVVVVGIDNLMIKQKIFNRELMSPDGERAIDAETCAQQIAILKAIKNYGIRRLISFHGRVKRAKDFANELKLIFSFLDEKERPDGILNSEYVSGAMKTKDRVQTIERLRNLKPKERRVLANARCLSEGVDVPTLDAIAFIDPKNSQTDIVQAVGRAIRKSEEKNIGTIIIPIFLDEENDLDQEAISSRFENVWRIILALKDQDDELNDKIDSFRISIGSRKVSKVNRKGLEKIHFDLPTSLNREFTESIYTHLVKNTSEDWKEIFGRLVLYLEENNGKMPKKSIPLLGRWIITQRTRFRKGFLEKERIDLLDSLDTWSWEPKDDEWYLKFIDLKEKSIKELEFSYQDINWMNKQKKYYLENQLNTFKINNLKSLKDWNWEYINLLDQKWMNKYYSLIKHLNGNNKLDEFKDFAWINNQKNNYKDGKLEKKYIELLERINVWTWDIYDRNKKNWQDNLQKLKKYSQDNKCDFLEIKDKKLAKWSQHQRSNYKNGDISRQQITQLESIDGWVWNVDEEKWHFMYKKVFKFSELNKHLYFETNSKEYRWLRENLYSFQEKKLSLEKEKLFKQIPNIWMILEGLNSEWYFKYKKVYEIALVIKYIEEIHQKDYKLFLWCNNQILKYKNGKLSENIIQLFANIKNWRWEKMNYKNFLLEKEWDQKLEELATYEKNYGTCFVDTDINLNLAKWTWKQREKNNQKKLSIDQIEKLDKLNTWSWDVLEESWDIKLKEFKQMVEKIGRVNKLPKSSVRKWVYRQKSIYKKGHMSQDRITKMEMIEGWDWNNIE